MLHYVMTSTASTNYFFFDNISHCSISANAIKYDFSIFLYPLMQSEIDFDLQCIDACPSMCIEISGAGCRRVSVAGDHVPTPTSFSTERQCSLS